MNYDEFSFFNRQLAAMLQDGIPLEGAIHKLCEDMRGGALRGELEQVEAGLSKGAPLKEALAGRNLPVFYKQMLDVGVRSNDLPGTLTLLADYYQRADTLWSRLKGLLVYPVIVITVSLALTLFLSVALRKTLGGISGIFAFPPIYLSAAWIAPIVTTALLIGALCVIAVPSWRAWWRWRLPAFREASLAQLASAMALMLRNGATLTETLGMAETLESGTAAGRALETWRGMIERGTSLQSLPVIKPFPPLFLWMLQKSPENPGIGFGKAAELYNTRASYRIEMALYGALPISMLLLGQMIFWQVAPMMRALIAMMNSLGNMD